MKEPKKIEIDNADSSISASHLDDVNKCHIMVMQWGELSSISLNKTQAKKLSNWLDKWIKYRECVKSSNSKEKKHGQK